MVKQVLLQNRVVLEIVEIENIRSDLDQLIEIMKVLREIGYSYAIDDITSGYNRIRLISETTPDYIKLDAPLIHKCNECENKQTIIKHMALIRAGIGSRVVAENMETPEELETVKQLRVKYAQGFHIAEPKKLEILYTKNNFKEELLV